MNIYFRNIATYLNLKCESNPVHHLYETSVTDPGLSRFEVVKWKLNSAQIIQSGSNYYWERIPATPPPQVPVTDENSEERSISPVVLVESPDILHGMSRSNNLSSFSLYKPKFLEEDENIYNSIDETDFVQDLNK